VPIELLDVAGLVPGAHEGKGLGNKFLDDLRHADALIHVVDVSGTTDAEGKATRGYDPTNDIVWLRGEIVRWIQGNLMGRWGSVKRRHVAVSKFRFVVYVEILLEPLVLHRYSVLILGFVMQKRIWSTRYKASSLVMAVQRLWSREYWIS
jgi:hypothetical protein